MAKHLREVYFGGNWTWSNLRDQLRDVTWEQSVKKVDGFNTIATLTYHIQYFARAITTVLEGKPLDSNDKFSFDHPQIRSQKDWDDFRNSIWSEAETLAQLIEKLAEEKLGEDFYDKKYGIYYRNIHGMIEHSHYHLGQIALMKKLVKNVAPY